MKKQYPDRKLVVVTESVLVYDPREMLFTRAGCFLIHFN